MGLLMYYHVNKLTLSSPELILFLNLSTLTPFSLFREAAEMSLVKGCQMAKFDPFLSLDCARLEGVGAQSKEMKGSNFAA